MQRPDAEVERQRAAKPCPEDDASKLDVLLEQHVAHLGVAFGDDGVIPLLILRLDPGDSGCFTLAGWRDAPNLAALLDAIHHRLTIDEGLRHLLECTGPTAFL